MKAIFLTLAFGLASIAHADQVPRFVENMIYTQSTTGTVYAYLIHSFKQNDSRLIFNGTGTDSGLTGPGVPTVSSVITVRFKDLKTASRIAQNFQGPKEMTLQIKLAASGPQPTVINADQSAVTFGDPDDFYCKDSVQSICAIEDLKGL